MYLIEEMRLTRRYTDFDIESYRIAPTQFGGVDLLCYNPDYIDGIECMLYDIETHKRVRKLLSEVDLDKIIACVHGNNIYSVTSYEYILYCWLDKGTPIYAKDEVSTIDKYTYSDFNETDFRFMNKDAMRWRFDKGYPCHTVMRLIMNYIMSNNNGVDLDVDSMKLRLFLSRVHDCRHFYGRVLPKLCNCIEYRLSCSANEFNRFVTKLKVLSL